MEQQKTPSTPAGERGEHGALWEVGVGNPDHLLLQGESGKFEFQWGFVCFTPLDFFVSQRIFVLGELSFLL